MAPYDAGPIVVRTKPPWSPWLQLTTVAVAGFAYLTVVLRDSSSDDAFVFCGAFFCLFSIVVGISAAGWRSRVLRVRVHDNGLEFAGDRITLPRQALRAVRVRNHGRSVTVLFERLFHPVELVFGGENEAHALLSALRLDSVQTVTPYRFVFRDRLRTTVCVLALVFTLIGSIAFHDSVRPVVLLALLVMFGLAVQLVRLVRIDVAPDCLLIRPVVGACRVISYATIASIDRDGHDIVMRISGQKSSLVISPAGMVRRYLQVFIESDAPRTDGFLAQIARQRTMHANGLRRDLGNLARAGRPVREWLDALTGSTQRDGYRVATVAAETLWCVVEDPKAMPSERAAAAASLRHALDHDERARLRVAAESCASPGLRRTFVAAAANATDEELALAIETVSDHEAMGPRLFGGGPA